MIHSVTFKQDFRCFKKDETFSFFTGVTLLVGDQGSGKSSLLSLLRRADKNEDIISIDCPRRIETYSFDFEHDNVRIKGDLCDPATFKVKLSSIFSSHGESVNAVLNTTKQGKNVVFFMDEPDMALSIRSCYRLIETFNQIVSQGCQIVAAVHNPIVIQGFDIVLSLEHKKVMSSKEFVESHTL